MSPRRHKLADALAQRPGLDRDPGPERGHSFLLAPGERHIAIHRFVSLPYLRPQSSMAALPTASPGTRGLSLDPPCALDPAVSLPATCAGPGPGPGPIATERVGAGGSPTTRGACASRTVNGSPSPRASSDKNRFSSNSEYTSRAVQAVTGKTCIYTHDNNVGSHSPHTAAVEMRNHRISLERFPSLHWSCPRRWFPALP